MTEILKISLIAYMFVAMGQNGLIFTPYQKLIGKLPDWLSWPLGKCFKCFAGQLCFWVYLINRIALHKYDLFEHLVYVSAGIMASMVWDKLYHWLDENR
jgi:hypothetical protein